MSNDSEEKIKADEPAATKKSRRVPWNALGLLISTLVIIGSIFIVSISYCRLISVNMLLAEAFTRVENEMTLIQTQLKNQQNEFVQFRESRDNSDSYLKILEADHLITLANNNLQLTNDVQITIKMLELASQTIQNNNDARLNAVQQAIAADMEKLKNIVQPDVSDLYSKILAVNTQIDKLPLKTNETKVEPSKENNVQSWWQRGLQATLKVLRNIVTVRHTPQGVLPLVTQAEQAFLYQNFHALLTQTSWALLHKKNIIYQASLQQIINWVDIYFVADAAATKSVLVDLQQLQQIDVNPATPELTSVRAFQDYFSVTKQGA
jgi:uroporphyrin-3 C-methyltransferase